MSTWPQDKLLLHLPLQGELPVSFSTETIENHNVSFDQQEAVFNGRDAYLEVSETNIQQLGTDDFSIVARLWTSDHLPDMVGDILSLFDSAERRGICLSIKEHSGAVTSQTNHRNLHFEIDDGTSPLWEDFGRVGTAIAVWALAVHNGELYAGTYEQSVHESGAVYRYLGESQWHRCSSLDGSNTVSALAEFQGKLYAATRTEDAHGSLLDLSTNSRPGGNVYRMELNETWTYCGKVCEQNNVFGLTVFDDHLYAWPAYAKGVYRYEGDTEWRKVNSPDSRLLAMSPYHGEFFAAANRLSLLDPNVTHAGPDGDPNVQTVVGKQGVYRLGEHDEWIGCGNLGEETQVYSLAVHEGRLYAGTWPSGKVFCYEGESSWQDCGRLGNEDEVMGLAVYNGMLYAGGLPSASIYRFDGPDQWVNIGQADCTPEVPLRRAINMSVFRGSLCIGTLPSGRVQAVRIGQVASCDRSFPGGWHTIAAIRREGRLLVYLDGEQVASSPSLPTPLNLNTSAPLRIGAGRHDYFNGKMQSVRIYERALTDEEIKAGSQE